MEKNIIPMKEMNNNKRNKITLTWIFIPIAVFCAILLILMVVMYFSTFNGGVSTNPQDWITFGTYFTAVISLANLLFFIVITIYVAWLQNKSADKQISQEKDLHLLDYKWKRLEDLNRIINTIQTISAIPLGEKGFLHISRGIDQLNRSVILFSNRNEALFINVKFEDARKKVEELMQYKERIRGRKEYTEEDAQTLYSYLISIDNTLNDLAILIQNDLISM